MTNRTLKNTPGAVALVSAVVLAAGIVIPTTASHVFTSELWSAANTPDYASGGTTNTIPSPSSSAAQPVDPATALRQWAANDSARAESYLVGRWVPQVGAAAQSGPDSDPPNDLAKFQALKAKYGGVLLDSSDYNFKNRGYWVIVVPQTYTSGDQALRWCKDRALSNNDCFAKLITHDSTIEHTTVHH